MPAIPKQQPAKINAPALPKTTIAGLPKGGFKLKNRLLKNLGGANKLDAKISDQIKYKMDREASLRQTRVEIDKVIDDPQK